MRGLIEVIRRRPAPPEVETAPVVAEPVQTDHQEFSPMIDYSSQRSSASELAIMGMKSRLRKGKTIEVPSLGITLTAANLPENAPEIDSQLFSIEPGNTPS